jgi:hypothetical protein
MLMADIYRLLYCSRNSLAGSIEGQKNEIENILAKSRANNSTRGITGALLFNSGFFAQVLEGPLEQVERTFETIQRDMRHDDISVLECGNVPHRDFPQWSMAYASDESSDSSGLADISSLLRSLVVPDDEYTLV